MVTFSENIPGWDAIGKWFIRAKICGFKNTGRSRNISVDARIGKFLLVKCSQELSNSKKESSLFCFWKFLCLLDLKICFCLKRATPWLELRIKFNQYSMRSFQRLLLEFNNLWIHFSFREFNWVTMSKIHSLLSQMQKVELGI